MEVSANAPWLGRDKGPLSRASRADGLSNLLFLLSLFIPQSRTMSSLIPATVAATIAFQDVLPSCCSSGREEGSRKAATALNLLYRTVRSWTEHVTSNSFCICTLSRCRASVSSEWSEERCCHLSIGSRIFFSSRERGGAYEGLVT